MLNVIALSVLLHIDDYAGMILRFLSFGTLETLYVPSSGKKKNTLKNTN